jgi:hypothetical protein
LRGEIRVKSSNVKEKKRKTPYWVDITSNISGILEFMSSEDAISGTRQSEAITVTDRLKYASRLLSPPLDMVPFPIPFQ